MPRHNEKLFAKVLDCIREGTFARKACGEVGISRATFWRWLELPDEGPGLRERYMRARSEGADVRFEKLLDISQEARDALANMDPEDRRANALIQTYRMQIDAEKWALKMISPEKYNEAIKLQGELGVSFTDLARKAAE